MRRTAWRSFALCGAIALGGCTTRHDDSMRADTLAAARSETAAATPIDTAPMTAEERGLFAPLPSEMTSPEYPSSPELVALGRRLFHEPVLSIGHDVTCASCHSLNGFGADGRRVSFGHLGQTGSRNAPSVYNAAGQIAQFWDGRAASVEEQAKGPVLEPLEMGMPDTVAVLAHMNGSALYREAFRAAFPTQRHPINYDNVGRAIGAFERGLVTPSRWDRYLEGDSAALTPAELRGATTFVRVGCASCHAGAYVGGSMFRKIGLVKPWPSQADSGRYNVTHRAEDLFVFKVPPLRNVVQTSPYFHDGSINDLHEAVRLMWRHQLGRELTDAEIQSIVAWLGTLTGDIPVRYIAFPQLPDAGR